MGITAFPVLARILAERKLINTLVGLFAISCAAVDDLSAWCLLAVTVITRPGGQGIGLPLRFAALAAYVLVMVFVIRPVARRLFPLNESPALGRFSAVMILLMASVWTTEALAVHALFVSVPGGPGDAQRRAERAPRIDDAEPVAAAVLRLYRFAHEPLLSSIGLWLLCGLIVVVAVASKLVVSAVCVRRRVQKCVSGRIAFLVRFYSAKVKSNHRRPCGSSSNPS